MISLSELGVGDGSLIPVGFALNLGSSIRSIACRLVQKPVWKSTLRSVQLSCEPELLEYSWLAHR